MMQDVDTELLPLHMQKNAIADEEETYARLQAEKAAREGTPDLQKSPSQKSGLSGRFTEFEGRKESLDFDQQEFTEQTVRPQLKSQKSFLSQKGVHLTTRMVMYTVWITWGWSAFATASLAVYAWQYYFFTLAHS